MADRSDSESPRKTGRSQPQRPGQTQRPGQAQRSGQSANRKKGAGRLPGRSDRTVPDAAERGEPAKPRLKLQWITRGRDTLILQQPSCARERQEDLEEVYAMIEGGEPEVARDELLYLVSGCRAFFDAHNLLGRLAADEGDLAVARGHYGFVFESVLKGLPEGFRGRLPADADYNRAFFEGGQGLARVLVALEQLEEAGQVLRRLATLDPKDEVTRELREEWDELNGPGRGDAALVQLRLVPHLKPPETP